MAEILRKKLYYDFWESKNFWRKICFIKTSMGSPYYYAKWCSEATTSGGVFTCKFHILLTNSILLVNLPTIVNKFTNRTCSFNNFFYHLLIYFGFKVRRNQTILCLWYSSQFILTCLQTCL